MALSLAEREEISRALVAGESIRSTAARPGRAPSTISREIKRNGGVEAYRASQAEDAAWDRGRRPKRCKLQENRSLARLVAEKLRMLWSPEQIAGWLKLFGSSTCKVPAATMRVQMKTAWGTDVPVDWKDVKDIVTRN